jgi:transmembrane sensor
MEEKYTLAQWLNNELTEAELTAFKASAAFEQYEKIRKFSEKLKTPYFDADTVLETILKSKKSSPKVVPLYKKWLPRVAALLVLGLGVAFALQNFVPQKQVAQNGTKTTFALPDHSEVVLNSGSEITYKNWNWYSNRNLKLQGEAYFKVAHGQKFQVQTHLGCVTVVGTQFNVKARKNRFEISCFEGRVRVNYSSTQLVLTHGQSVVFENGLQTNTAIIDAKPDWLTNRIAFEKAPLKIVLEEIERQYNVTIHVGNTPKELFSGKIPTDNLDTALRIISTTYQLKPKKTTNNILFLEEK